MHAYGMYCGMELRREELGLSMPWVALRHTRPGLERPGHVSARAAEEVAATVDVAPMIPEHSIETPALVYDEATLMSDLEASRAIANRAGCRLLFSLKACYLPPVLERIARVIDGFSCSSLFEVLLAHEMHS